ncbi:MAG TPA: type II toxin-antitoxin system HicB family antitoxin [Stellaceae bacterium]|nr:type II toxin-antitoxin system HicB family antitoxin [Stellaceae bacterium]
MSKNTFVYPVHLEPDGGGFVVTFPDFPFGVTEGDNKEEALTCAQSALETIIMALMDERKDIPRPSPARGRASVTLPPGSGAKVALYLAMREQGIGKTDLARRLGWHLPQVDRVLDIRHASKLDQLSQALRAVGKELVLGVRDAA